MFSQSTLAALLAAPLAANAHYIFSQLIVNGEAIGGDYAHVRQNTNTYMPSFTDDIINSEDLRCNAGAGNAATETYDVVAGDTVGFKLAYNEFIEHPGPGFIYMSLADGGDVSSYDGSGDWFKVWESGPENGPANVDASWGTWQKDSMSFTIPKDIPDGEYLVRFEHVAIHENHVGKSQFYMECAQLSISGGGDGVPGPTAQIPGMYTAEDPAFTYSIWGGTDPGYTMPGPAVWTGGASGGASSSSSSSAGASTESGNTTEAPASSDASASTGGEMTASVPAQGSWGTASDETTTTETKPECEVQYIGGSASRARRAVRA